MRYQKWGDQGHRLVCYSSQESSNARFGKADSCDNERFIPFGYLGNPF